MYLLSRLPSTFTITYSLHGDLILSKNTWEIFCIQFLLSLLLRTVTLLYERSKDLANLLAKRITDTIVHTMISKWSSITLLCINIQFYFLPFASFYPCFPIEIHASTSRIRCDNVVNISYHKKKNKKNSKIDTVSVDILSYFKSNQFNDIQLLWETIIWMDIVQWNRVAIKATTQREEKLMETTAQREGITLWIVTPTIQWTETKQ